MQSASARQLDRLFLIVALLLLARCADAVELWSEEDGSQGDLDVAGKLTSLGGRRAE